jgi:ubiquinone/menaquinone biosynthesis C-methylase UbiE
LPAIINTYPSEYIQRLRVYNIDQDFSILPQQQFGCIACCNFLNLYNLSDIKNLLATYNTLLRPGGKLICNLQFLHNTTISDIVEENYFNYTIRLIIQNIFNDIGYSVISLNEMLSDDVMNMLITVEKFGMLTTTKAHQVLGAIIEK